jgi:hypothetical protein
MRSRSPPGCVGARWRRRRGTGTPRPCARSWPTPRAIACCRSCASRLTGGASRPTARARCPRPRSSGCGAGATSHCARRDAVATALRNGCARERGARPGRPGPRPAQPARRDPRQERRADYVHWQSGTGHLLARPVAGRLSGPVFLTARHPRMRQHEGDRQCRRRRAELAGERAQPFANGAQRRVVRPPQSFCARTPAARALLYRRAQELFASATGGWTLHQLRHCALTHLAEQSAAPPLLMAKSRHTSLRSLWKDARPGVDVVAKLTADHDPARRRP